MKDIARNPKKIHSYENDDADGNRGEWITFYLCPDCGNELSDEELDNEECSCGQKLTMEDYYCEY